MRKSKKKLAIALGATQNMAFALANTMIGLKKHDPSLKADFIIFHQELFKKDKKLLQSIFPCKFIKYKFPLAREKFHEGHTLGKFTELTFSRYECFDLLDKYEKVLWLDIDILIQKDISSLLNKASKGISMLKIKKNIDFLEEPEEIKNVEYSYNAGVILLRDNLPNYKELKSWCYKKTEELAPLLASADQGIINLMIINFKLDVEDIGIEFNTYPGQTELLSKAVIVHSYCPEKFWNYWNFPEWNNNYDEWLKMGGTSYKDKRFQDNIKSFKDIPNFFKNPRGFLKKTIKMFNYLYKII